MNRIFIFCEGQTEETFVRDVLCTFFELQGLYVYPIIFSTSTGHKGGISSYLKVKRQIEIKCKEDCSSWVTTLVDYYGLPENWIGLNESKKNVSIFDKILTIEEVWQQDMGCVNFIPNLLLHEFEALLFSQPEKFSDWFEQEDVDLLIQETSSFETPEHINNSKITSPSKRILKLLKSYQKPLHGSLIAQEIGLDEIRNNCQHFNSWIEKLLSLKTQI